jgi:hypothetical protein
VGDEDETREQGYLIRAGSISLFERGQIQCQDEKPIHEDSRGNMDEDIHQMISPDIKLAPIVVQGKCEIGENPNRISIGTLEQSFEVVQ